eukprot:scaffold24860_cov122-Cylindrotheca_fusiformis.AAC.5
MVRGTAMPGVTQGTTSVFFRFKGVGKSSLISTFVSRHFSEVVPGIMTRVRLPPDPENAYITTIVDSQGGDVALSSAIATMSIPGGASVGSSASLSSLRQSISNNALNSLGGVENVDSIILVYDLDRDETFFRLENHWLPLIERCYNGGLPVIVAGTKMDLFLPSSTAGVTDEQVLARSRQQIVSLMQRFRFIRQCIKCSAKNLLRVDEVFLKAQQAVLYPFTPLYDLDVGKLSIECKRALTRIFRMYDRDYDGLLSHNELDRFQHETFKVPVYERDLIGWKKVVSRNSPNEEVVRDGKFTVAGFLAIFDVFITQNRLDVPWKALRKFGYNDDLILRIPETILMDAVDGMHGPWRLSESARTFLADVFHQFDSDHDGILSLEDMERIFSIIPNPSLPIWHPIRSVGQFQGCFSLPKMPSDPAGSGSVPRVQDISMSQSLSASGITIVSGDSFPTVDMSSVSQTLDTNVVSKPLSFLDWMGLWHVASSISPAITRAELFRLGHVEDGAKKSKRKRSKKKVAPMASNRTKDSFLSSREARVLLLGSPGSGKTALLNALCCVDDPLATSKSTIPMTSSTHVRLKKVAKSGKGDMEETIVVHLLITDVPEAEAENQVSRQQHFSEILRDGNCDLVMLAFDSTNSASLAYAKHLEETLLTDDIARVYVGTKSDQSDISGNASTSFSEDASSSHQTMAVLDRAASHCEELDLEPPLVTSATETMLSAEGNAGELNRRVTLEHLARSCLSSESGMKRLRTKPHEESKRRDAARRRNQKMVWFGIGVVGVAAAFAGYLWTGTSSSKDGERKGTLEWFKNLFKRRSPSVSIAEP